jgi:hypothetical protein
VDNPLSLTLADLMAMPTVTQTITSPSPILSAGISSAPATGPASRCSSSWAGWPAAGAKEPTSEAADGFYESVAMQDLQIPARCWSSP